MAEYRYGKVYPSGLSADGIIASDLNFGTLMYQYSSYYFYLPLAGQNSAELRNFRLTLLQGVVVDENIDKEG